MTITLRACACLVTCLPPLQTSLQAQGASTGQLARVAQNPLANIVSFPFEDNTSFNIGVYDGVQNVPNIQPVIPFRAGKVITRTIGPIVWQPDITTDVAVSTSLGDIQFTAVVARSTPGGVTWGAGPMLTFPTGGASRGAGRWSVGPSFVVLAMPGPWAVGGLINHSRSFAGDGDRADVSQLLIQPHWPHTGRSDRSSGGA